MKTNRADLQLAADFEYLKAFNNQTDAARFLLHSPAKTIGIFSGNQGGKTATVAWHYVLRALGKHPVPEKNRLARKIRCMSTSLPEDDSAEEQDNTQYLELKKLIPPSLIVKDITSRKKNLVIRRPPGLSSEHTIFEFRSHKQERQDLGKIQLSSVWHDEETPLGHRTECKVRLLKEDGDEIFTLTPTNALCFDEETEIITDKGWRKYNEIKMSEKILTYNLEKDCLEWKPIIGFYLNYYEGPMISMKQKSFDALVTPDHKWVVANDRRKDDFYLEKTKSLNSKHFIKRMTPNIGYNEDNPYYTDEFIQLVGWVATDGSINKSHVTIYQSKTANKLKCDKIDELLSKFPGDYTRREREYGGQEIYGKQWDGWGIVCIWGISGNLRLQLANVIDSPKSISQEFICSLSYRQLQLLLYSMLDGDGHVYENGSLFLGQTHNQKIVDDFALIGTLMGRTVRTARVKYGRKHGFVARSPSIHSRMYGKTHIKSMDIATVDYKGFVWCPSTENQTVVMRRNGNVSISGNTYTFDEVWQRAEKIYRTKAIVDRWGFPRIEKPNVGTGIECLQMATDDNPTLSMAAIERLFEDITDPDELAIVRWGIFKAITGRVHKTYDPAICYIDFDKIFDNGEVPYRWVHGRGIDYHESRTPWSIGWISASPDDEWFLWQEFHPAIDGQNAYNTYDIAKAIARKSGDYYYTVNLIDPLANKKQPNTLFSATDDLNRYFDQIVRETGVGTPTFWEGWDTKGTTGRQEIAKRFKNAVRCGRPFNNLVKEKGRVKRLPTLWISHKCPRFNKSIINWAFGEYVTSQTKAVNDPKNVPQQRWSHDNMVLGCMAKDARLLYAAHFINNPVSQIKRKHISVTGR